MDFNIVYKKIRNAINSGSTFADGLDNVFVNGITYEFGDGNSLNSAVGTVANEGMYVISGVETYLKLAEVGAEAPTGFNMDVETYLKLAEAINTPSIGNIYPTVFGVELQAGENYGIPGFSPKSISKDSVPFIPSVSKVFSLLSDNSFISNNGIVESGYKRNSKVIAPTTYGDLWQQGVPGVLPIGAIPPSFIDPTQEILGGLFEMYAQNIAGFSILPRIIKDFSTNQADFEDFINTVIEKGLVIQYYSLVGQNGERFQRYSFGSVENYMQMLEV
jgi:hypothetical protein